MASQDDSKRMMDGLSNGLLGFVAGFRHGWATAAEQQGNPARKPLSEDLKETTPGRGWSDYGSDLIKAAKGWGYLILLCFVGYAIYCGYEWLDSIGWISHSEETVISARGDWLVGESKECFSSP